MWLGSFVQKSCHAESDGVDISNCTMYNEV